MAQVDMFHVDIGGKQSHPVSDNIVESNESIEAEMRS